MISPLAARPPLTPADRPADDAGAHAFTAVLATVHGDASDNAVRAAPAPAAPAPARDVATVSDPVARKDSLPLAAKNGGRSAAKPAPPHGSDDNAAPTTELPPSVTVAPSATAPQAVCEVTQLCPAPLPLPGNTDVPDPAVAPSSVAMPDLLRSTATASRRSLTSATQDAVADERSWTGLPEVVAPSGDEMLPRPMVAADAPSVMPLTMVAAPLTPVALPVTHTSPSAAASLASALLAQRFDGGEGQRDWARALDAGGSARVEAWTQTLGPVAIEVARGADGLAITLGARTDETRTLLADAQPRLVADARAAGLALSQSRVDDAPHGARHGGGRPPRPRFVPLDSTSPAATLSPADRYA